MIIVKTIDIFSFILNLYDKRFCYTSLERELFVNKFSEYKFFNENFKLLPDIFSKTDLNANVVKIFSDEVLDKNFLNNIFMRFRPFRKGPFSVFDIFVDSEWKSYLKWNRFIDKIEPIHKKTVSVCCPVTKPSARQTWAAPGY